MGGGWDHRQRAESGGDRHHLLITPPKRQKTPEQGAATSALLATSPDLESIRGRYFDDCNEAPTVDRRDAAGTGVASHALDPANAHQLWDVSDAHMQHA